MHRHKRVAIRASARLLSARRGVLDCRWLWRSGCTAGVLVGRAWTRITPHGPGAPQGCASTAARAQRSHSWTCARPALSTAARCCGPPSSTGSPRAPRGSTLCSRGAPAAPPAGIPPGQTVERTALGDRRPTSPTSVAMHPRALTHARVAHAIRRVEPAQNSQRRTRVAAASMTSAQHAHEARADGCRRPAATSPCRSARGTFATCRTRCTRAASTTRRSRCRPPGCRRRCGTPSRRPSSSAAMRTTCSARLTTVRYRPAVAPAARRCASLLWRAFVHATLGTAVEHTEVVGRSRPAATHVPSPGTHACMCACVFGGQLRFPASGPVECLYLCHSFGWLSRCVADTHGCGITADVLLWGHAEQALPTCGTYHIADWLAGSLRVPLQHVTSTGYGDIPWMDYRTVETGCRNAVAL